MPVWRLHSAHSDALLLPCRRCARPQAASTALSSVRITRGRDDTVTFTFLQEDNVQALHSAEAAAAVSERLSPMSGLLNGYCAAVGVSAEHSEHSVLTHSPAEAALDATLHARGNGSTAAPAAQVALARNGSADVAAVEHAIEHAVQYGKLRGSAPAPAPHLAPARGSKSAAATEHAVHNGMPGHRNGHSANLPALRGNGVHLGQPGGASEEAAIAHFRRQEQLGARPGGAYNGAATWHARRPGAARDARDAGAPRRTGLVLAPAQVAGAEAEAVTAAYSNLAAAGGLEEALALVEAAVQAGRDDVLSRCAALHRALWIGSMRIATRPGHCCGIHAARERRCCWGRLCGQFAAMSVCTALCTLPCPKWSHGTVNTEWSVLVHCQHWQCLPCTVPSSPLCACALGSMAGIHTL